MDEVLLLRAIVQVCPFLVIIIFYTLICGKKK